MSDDYTDQAIDAALKSRRIPHGRSSQKFGKGSRDNTAKPSTSFDPLRSRGRYVVTIGNSKAPTNSWLEIHELTPSRDGLLGTFSFDGKEEGMCVLAGSRKGLAKITAELDAEGEDTAISEEDEHDSNSMNNSGEEDVDLESEEEKQNVITSFFEKNTFRTPKFWMTWKNPNPPLRRVALDSAEHKRTAYLIFSGNDCQRFEGTITSTASQWDNKKIRGRKVHSRATPCPLIWSELS